MLVQVFGEVKNQKELSSVELACHLPVYHIQPPAMESQCGYKEIRQCPDPKKLNKASFPSRKFKDFKVYKFNKYRTSLQVGNNFSLGFCTAKQLAILSNYAFSHLETDPNYQICSIPF